MLASLRDLEVEIHGRDQGACDEVMAHLPASLTALDLRVPFALDSVPVLFMAQAVRISGLSALKRLRLCRQRGFDSWDLSGLKLGALTALEMDSYNHQPQQVPAWLPSCTALRKLRLRTGGGFEGTSLPLQQAGDGLACPLTAIVAALDAAAAAAAAALPPGALAGLGSLELLEVARGRQYGGQQWSDTLRIVGREALRHFTAVGRRARFPAVAVPPDK